MTVELQFTQSSLDLAPGGHILAHNMTTRFIFIAAVLFLSGCDTEDSISSDISAESEVCRASALDQVSVPQTAGAVSAGSHEKAFGQDYRACMANKGYELNGDLH
jgi:hypothetical protein